MTSGYDRAITVFSPDGHLFQVEYALEAVRKGATAVAVKAENCIVLGVEKKSTAALQESRTVRKVCKIDAHVSLAFAGLTADARVLVNRARMECQSHRLTVEDAVSVEYISRYVARLQQRYTQRGGRRPFGLSTLIVGFDDDGTGAPHVFQTDPSGTYSEWTANAIGRNDKTVREYLEKHYDADGMDEKSAVRLTVQALLEVVESGSKNIQIYVLRQGQPGSFQLPHEKIDEHVKKINQEKEDAKNKDKKSKTATTVTTTTTTTATT